MNKIILLLIVLISFFSCKQDEPKEVIPFESFDKPIESFIINNERDTIIEGKEGTLVFVEKKSFIDRNGNPIDSVELKLEEAYSVEDILFQNLSTRTGDKLLETGGMINLKAYSGKEQLNLESGKSVVVHFPKKETDKEMNLFYGKEKYNGDVEWELEEASTSEYTLRDSIVPWLTKYNNLDNEHLYLDSGNIWFRELPKIFNLKERDKKELINNAVDLHYVVNTNGQLIYKRTAGSRVSNRLTNKLEKVVLSFPKCKPYTVNGVPIDMPGWFRIWTKVIPPKYQTNKSYLNSIEEKMTKKGSTKGLKLAELQYYIFDSKKLGWMNCDLFIEQGKEVIDYLVKVPESKNVFTKIIFKNYNSVMTGDQEKNIFKFETFPLDEPIKVVVIDEKRGKPYLEIIDTIVTSNILEVNELSQYTLDEMKDKLKELD